MREVCEQPQRAGPAGALRPERRAAAAWRGKAAGLEWELGCSLVAAWFAVEGCGGGKKGEGR
jgi:hypothetical protein